MTSGPYMLIRSRAARILEIGQGLAPKGAAFEEIAHVPPKFGGGSPASEVLEQALNSAQKQARSGFAQSLKKRFLSAQYSWLVSQFRKRKPGTVICWNGLKGHRLLAMHAAKATGHQTIYLEEAPLPARITVDAQGVNFGNSLPRDARFYQKWAQQTPEALGAWKEVRDTIVPRGATAKQAQPTSKLAQKRFLFCPLQVPRDSQLTVYGDWCPTVEATIKALKTASEALPDGWHLRLKEHPSSAQRFTEQLRALEDDRFVLDNDADTRDLMKHAQAVVTVNSSVGLEAMFYERPVITLGRAFYAFKGMALHCGSLPELVATLKSCQTLSIDTTLRSAYLDYLITEYFPLEDDVRAGRFTDLHRQARDARMQQILAEIA